MAASAASQGGWFAKALRRMRPMRLSIAAWPRPPEAVAGSRLKAGSV